MKIEDCEYELRIVKVISGGEISYEVRCQARDGIERLVAHYYSAALAQKSLDTFKVLSADAKLAAVALFSVLHLAGRIAYATDDVGTGLYATKSHMRAWARDISDTLGSVLDIFEEKSKAGNPCAATEAAAKCS